MNGDTIMSRNIHESLQFFKLFMLKCIWLIYFSIILLFLLLLLVTCLSSFLDGAGVIGDSKILQESGKMSQDILDYVGVEAILC